jgi:hypothetical protein
MEAEVRDRRHGDQLDTQMKGEDGEDLVAVDRAPVRVHRKHPVAVAVERDPEVEAVVADDSPQE